MDNLLDNQLLFPNACDWYRSCVSKRTLSVMWWTPQHVSNARDDTLHTWSYIDLQEKQIIFHPFISISWNNRMAYMELSMLFAVRSNTTRQKQSHGIKKKQTNKPDLPQKVWCLTSQCRHPMRLKRVHCKPPCHNMVNEWGRLCCLVGCCLCSDTLQVALEKRALLHTVVIGFPHSKWKGKTASQ